MYSNATAPLFSLDWTEWLVAIYYLKSNLETNPNGFNFFFECYFSRKREKSVANSREREIGRSWNRETHNKVWQVCPLPCKTTTKSEISKEPGERHLFARRYLQLSLCNPGHFDFEFFEGSDWLRINDREYADRKHTDRFEKWHAVQAFSCVPGV